MNNDEITRHVQALTGDQVVDPRLERRVRRLFKPDGLCAHCEGPADQHDPVGPIKVAISEPDNCGESRVFEFCEWRCFAHWAAEEAGGEFIPSA
jgi:hypothetical protein